MIKINTIVEIPQIIKLVMGKQQVDKEILYRKLSYCKLFSDNSVYLIYNLLTCQLCELSELEYNILSAGKITYSKNIVKLIEDYFLVPIDFQDKKFADSLFQTQKILKKSNKNISYTILPTTACNARCFYCFELDKKHYSMDRKTAIAVSEYIIKHSNSDCISLSWFGGEPLCNVNAIDLICEQLLLAGKKVKSKITTNGYLFNPEIVNRALNCWNLYHVQITLDGTEKIYNETKNYINDNANAFNKVINNIDLLLKNNIRVRIRLNVTPSNADDLKDLCQFLSYKYSGNKNFSVYTAIVLNHDNENKPYLDFDKAEVVNKIIEINDIIYNNRIGFRGVLEKSNKSNFCMADDDYSYVIYPNGKIGKCEYFLEEHLIGNIYDDELSKDASRVWKKFKKETLNCENCVYYPTCFELEKCPNCFRDCDIYDRLLKGYNLEKKVLNTYKKYEIEN